MPEEIHAMFRFLFYNTHIHFLCTYIQLHIKNLRLPLRRHLQSKFEAQPPFAFLTFYDGIPFLLPENEKKRKEIHEKVLFQALFSSGRLRFFVENS